jgi:hypothetical protein
MILDRDSSVAHAKQKAAAKALKGDSLLSALFGDSLHLSKLGLPSGVILFLRCLFESSICFGLAFAAQFYLHQDNVARNNIRNECRSSDDPSNVACGYAAHHWVQDDAPPVVGLALYSYGACQEYAPSDGTGGARERIGTFERVDGAAFCATGGLSLAPRSRCDALNLRPCRARTADLHCRARTGAWLTRRRTRAVLYWYADLVILLAFMMRVAYLERFIEQR